MTYLRDEKDHKIVGCSPSGQIRPRHILYCQGCILTESCNLEIINNIKAHGQFTLPQVFVKYNAPSIDLEAYNEN